MAKELGLVEQTLRNWVKAAAGIRARHKRRYKVTTDSKHGLPVADNLLDRNFTPSAPNQAWTSEDIASNRTDENSHRKW